MLRAEVASQERDHLLELVVALSRIGEVGIVATSFVIVRLNGLPVPHQCRLELTRQRDLRIDASTIGWSVRGAVQEQHRHVEFGGPRDRPISVTRCVKNSRLHAAYREQILQGFAAATGMPNEAKPVGPCVWERTSRLHHHIDVLDCFWICIALQWRYLRTRNGRRHALCAAPASSGKPTRRDSEEPTARQILSPSHVLMGESMGAVQNHDDRMGPRG